MKTKITKATIPSGKEFKLRDRAERVMVTFLAEHDYYVPKRCMTVIGDKKVRVYAMYVSRFEKCIGEARRGYAEATEYYDKNLKAILENDEPISDKELDKIIKLALAGKPIKNDKTP